jgi:hypothetical protein
MTVTSWGCGNHGVDLELRRLADQSNSFSDGEAKAGAA